jgi:hypothetical protein
MKEEKGKPNLEMAEALDEMDKTLSSDNADFLEEVLKKLRHDVDLTDKEQNKLRILFKKHLGDDDDEEEEPAVDEEEEVDEDDFV